MSDYLLTLLTKYMSGCFSVKPSFKWNLFLTLKVTKQLISTLRLNSHNSDYVTLNTNVFVQMNLRYAMPTSCYLFPALTLLLGRERLTEHFGFVSTVHCRTVCCGLLYSCVTGDKQVHSLLLLTLAVSALCQTYTSHTSSIQQQLNLKMSCSEPPSAV